jgi:hypothetical protein
MMVLSGLFFSASLIYWGIVGLGVFGWLCVLGVCIQKGVVPFILGLVATIPVGLIGGLFLIGAVPFWIAMLWPSAINIVSSMLVVSFLPFSGMPKYLSFVCVSALLGFNLAMPAAIQDAFAIKAGELQVAKAINLSSDDFLSVEANIPKIIFHNPSIRELLDLGGNEGCMCGYWQVPRVMEEDVDRILQDEGIRYRIDKVSSGKNRLVINTDDQFGITQLDISLFQGAEKVASYHRKLRRHYSFEAWTENGMSLNSHDLDNLDMRIYFLAQSNFWNLLASMPSRMAQQHKNSREVADESLFPLSYFLQQTITKESRPNLGAEVQEIGLTTELIPENKLRDFESKRESMPVISPACLKNEKIPDGDRHEIKSGYRLNVRYRKDMLFEFDRKSLRVAPKWLSIGDVYCAESSYVVISHPANERYFHVHEYSVDGKLLTNHRIELPPIKGKWRKIQSFRNYPDAFVFDLVDMEPMTSSLLIAHK